MANFSSDERQRRSNFLNRCYFAGDSTSEAMRKYDAEFGTHYSQSPKKRENV